MMNTRGIFIANGQSEILAAQSRDPSVAPLQPEKRLMLAVLECAVNDFQTYAMVPIGRGKQLFTEVAAWFSSSASGPFDFDGICEATGLDPGYIRNGLLDWYRSQRPARSENRGTTPKTAAYFAPVCEIAWTDPSPLRCGRRSNAWVECMTLAAQSHRKFGCEPPRNGRRDASARDDRPGDGSRGDGGC